MFLGKGFWGLVVVKRSWVPVPPGLSNKHVYLLIFWRFSWSKDFVSSYFFSKIISESPFFVLNLTFFIIFMDCWFMIFTDFLWKFSVLPVPASRFWWWGLMLPILSYTTTGFLIFKVNFPFSLVYKSYYKVFDCFKIYLGLLFREVGLVVMAGPIKLGFGPRTVLAV